MVKGFKRNGKFIPLRTVKLIHQDSAGNKLIVDDDDRIVGLNNENRAVTVQDLGDLIKASKTGIKFTTKGGKFLTAIPPNVSFKLIPRPKIKGNIKITRLGDKF